jgi:hypothetical protein
MDLETSTVIPAIAAAPVSYVPSGRISWPHFLPLAGAALVLSFCLAYALYLSEARFFYLFVTPTVLSLPIMAMIVLAVYFGRCRNPLWAGSVGVLLMTGFYAGYWLFSYHFNIAALGSFGQAALLRATGESGFFGYFILRCKSAAGPRYYESPLFLAINAVARGLEFGLLLAIGLYAGRRLAVRAFFEDHGRWASSCAFLFHPRELPIVRAALDSQDWSRLDAIPKRPVTAEQRRSGGMLFRIEYLPRSSDQPGYITIEGPVLRRLTALLALAPVLGRWVTRLVSQRVVDADSLRMLSRHVGGLDLDLDLPPSGVGVEDPAPAGAGITAQAQAPTPARAAELAYWTPDQSIGQVSAARALGNILGEAGLIGGSAVRPGGDFRDAASAATATALIGRWPDGGIEALEGVDSSLCFPAEPDPQPALRRLNMLEIVLSYVFVECSMAGAASTFIAGGFRQSFDEASAQLVHFVGSCIFALGALVAVFLCVGLRWIQGVRMLWRFRRRPGSLLRRPIDLPWQVLRLEDAKTFHVTKFLPEDWCIGAFDGARRRLLIEGVSHRYLIRSQDVVDLRPAPRGASTAVIVRYRIGPEELGIVLIRPNTAHVLLYSLSRLPLVGLPLRPFAGHGSAKLAKRFSAVLGVPLATDSDGR